MAAPIPTPSGNLVAWLLANPEAVKEAIDFLNKVRAMNVRFVAPFGPQVGGTLLVESATNITLPIPIQFARTIQHVTTGGTTDANCRAKVDEILDAMTQVGQNP